MDINSFEVKKIGIEKRYIMNQEEKFMRQIEENIETLSLEKMKSLVIELSKVIPSSFRQHLLCIIKNLNNNLVEDNDVLDKMKEEICSDFKEIENGNICLRCYSYETGVYSYYDADLDFEYLITRELNEILNKTYNYIKDAVWHKKYSDVIEIFDLLLFTEYVCEEVGNPEYDDFDEVYDSFKRNLNDFKDLLDFDFNELLLYAIYSVIIKMRKYLII